MQTTKWDRRYLDLASFIGTWSKDPRARIGAVVVNAKNRVVGLGYNGFPVNVADDDRLDGHLKNDLMLHAEANALMQAGPKARGSTIYVAGKPVCVDCAGRIIQASASRVVAHPPPPGTASKWAESGRMALEMFAEAGLDFTAADKIDG